jgi:hypothetical protein
MKSRSFSVFLASCLMALALGCRSSSGSSGSKGAAEVPCICGTPQGDLEGCAHRTCLEGETNPDNPDCVCGKLSIPK